MHKERGCPFPLKEIHPRNQKPCKPSYASRPPPLPSQLDLPDSLQNIQSFLHCFNAFVEDALHSGLWRMGEDVMGFACIVDVQHPTGLRDEFFRSIERGNRRYYFGDVTEAYRHWRLAAKPLQLAVRARKPSPATLSGRDYSTIGGMQMGSCN